MSRKLLALSFILLLVVSLVPSVLAQNPKFEVSSRKAILREDKIGTFKIYVLNLNNSRLIFSTDVINVPSGWKAEVKPLMGVIEPYSNATIILRVEVPEFLPRAEANITVVIKYMFSGDPVIHEHREYFNILVIRPYKILGLFDNTLPPPYNNEYFTFIFTVIGWTLISLFFIYCVGPLILLLTQKTKTEIDDILYRILKKPLLSYVVVYGLITSLIILPIPLVWLEYIYLAFEIFTILLFTYLAYRIFKDLAIYYGKKFAQKTATNLDDVLIPILEKIGTIAIFCAGAIWLMSTFGINVTYFVAGMGIIGIILGFAMQDTLGNLFAGIFLLADNPFLIGDYIMLAGDKNVYQVVQVGARSTKLYNIFDHTLQIVPNRRLADSVIINMVRPDSKYKIAIEVGVSYKSNVEKVMDVLKKVALEHPNVLKDPPYEPVVRFSNFGSSALEFRLILWVDNVLNQWRVASEIREKILKAFRENGIEIPYQQIDIYIKKA